MSDDGPPALAHPGADAGRRTERPAHGRCRARTRTGSRRSSPASSSWPSSSSPCSAPAYWQNWRPWILGGTLGSGLFLLGFGLTAWGKYLMPQGPFVEERHPLASTPGGARRHGGRPGRALRRRRQAAQDAGRALRRSAPASSALSPLFPLLRSLGPLPGDSLDVTDWRKGTVLVDSNGRPVRRDTLVVGGIMTVYPQNTVNPQTGYITDSGQAVDQTVLIRLSDQPFTTMPGREDWTPDGLRRLLQAVHPPRLPGRPLRAGARAAGVPVPPVDVQRPRRRGARVRTGTAAAAPDAPRLQRPGYLIAMAPYDQAVGPGFWERTT